MGIVKKGKKINDATAVPSDVMSGKVFYNNDGRQVGTHPKLTISHVFNKSIGGTQAAYYVRGSLVCEGNEVYSMTGGTYFPNMNSANTYYSGYLYSDSFKVNIPINKLGLHIDKSFLLAGTQPSSSGLGYIALPINSALWIIIEKSGTSTIIKLFGSNSSLGGSHTITALDVTKLNTI